MTITKSHPTSPSSPQTRDANFHLNTSTSSRVPLKPPSVTNPKASTPPTKSPACAFCTQHHHAPYFPELCGGEDHQPTHITIRNQDGRRLRRGSLTSEEAQDRFRRYSRTSNLYGSLYGCLHHSTTLTPTPHLQNTTKCPSPPKNPSLANAPSAKLPALPLRQLRRMLSLMLRAQLQQQSSRNHHPRRVLARRIARRRSCL